MDAPEADGGFGNAGRGDPGRQGRGNCGGTGESSFRLDDRSGAAPGDAPG